MAQNWKTRHTLIDAARNKGDEAVWAELVTHYLPFIRHLLQQIGIPLSDLEDIAQEVLITLWKKLELYKKEKGKFRTWLGTVIRHTAYNTLDKRKREQRKRDALRDENSDELNQYSEPEFQQIVDQEWKSYLANLALKQLESVFGENARQCFLDGMQGISATDTAERLQLSVETVYSSRKRVKARLLRELQNLRQQIEF